MGFNLADVLSDVSKLDTNREQIEYIKLDLIDADPNNFYQLSGVEDLAANIQLCGLQQPIRVRKHPAEVGRYMVISGHRRREAVLLLAKDDPEKWNEVACIIEETEASPALQQLRLIYANSNTRAMTSAELSEQAVQVERLLYQLKEEGYEFPGRMRDHVAQAVNASKTKLARLKVIRENLSECWYPLWQKNQIAESTAYALAKCHQAWQKMIFVSAGEHPTWVTEGRVATYAQRFERIVSKHCEYSQINDPCVNQGNMMSKSCTEQYVDPCRCGCCMDCDNLRTCKNACHRAKAKKESLREIHEAAAAEEAARVAERDKPLLDIVRNVYARVGEARKAAGVTVEALYRAQCKMYLASVDDPKQLDMEQGKAKINANTTLPFGYSFYASDVQKLCAVADLLHCSVDYLLGRQEAVSSLDTGWQTGDPTEIGDYAVVIQYDEMCKPSAERMSWNGNEWMVGKAYYDPDVDGKLLGWMIFPEVE